VVDKLGDMGIIAAPLTGDAHKDDRAEIMRRLRAGRLGLVRMKLCYPFESTRQEFHARADFYGIFGGFTGTLWNSHPSGLKRVSDLPCALIETPHARLARSRW